MIYKLKYSVLFAVLAPSFLFAQGFYFSDPCVGKQDYQELLDDVEKRILSLTGSSTPALFNLAKDHVEKEDLLWRSLLATDEGGRLLFEGCASDILLTGFESGGQLHYENVVRKYPPKIPQMTSDLRWLNLRQVKSENPDYLRLGTSVLIANCDTVPTSVGGLHWVITSVQRALPQLISCMVSRNRKHDAALIIELLRGESYADFTVQCARKGQYIPLNGPNGGSWAARGYHSLSPSYPGMTINISSFIPEEISLTHLKLPRDLPSTIGHEVMHLLGYTHADKIKKKLGIDITSVTEQCCFNNDSKACDKLASAPDNEFNVHEAL